MWAARADRDGAGADAACDCLDSPWQLRDLAQLLPKAPWYCLPPRRPVPPAPVHALLTFSNAPCIPVSPPCRPTHLLPLHEAALNADILSNFVQDDGYTIPVVGGEDVLEQSSLPRTKEPCISKHCAMHGLWCNIRYASPTLRLSGVRKPKLPVRILLRWLRAGFLPVIIVQGTGGSSLVSLFSTAAAC